MTFDTILCRPLVMLGGTAIALGVPSAVSAMGIAGSLAAKKTVPAFAGTFRRRDL